MGMRRRVECDCGWSFQGEEAELIAAVQEHGRVTHGMTVTAEQALAMSQPA
jgi:predicted small metal-binding protein